MLAISELLRGQDRLDSLSHAWFAEGNDVLAQAVEARWDREARAGR